MARSFAAASSQYLSGTGTLVSAAPLSFACWFYDVAGGGYGLVALGSAATSWYLGARFDAGGVYIFNSDVNSVGTAANYTLNAWHHAAGTADGSGNLAAYLNGANKGATSFSAASVSSGALVGARYFGGSVGRHMDGRIAEAAVWDVQLTDAEVAVLASGVPPPLVRPASLVAYWPLWGRYSTEIDPVGGAGLTVTGATYADHPRVVRPARRRLLLPAAAGGGGGGDAVPQCWGQYRRRRG